MDYRFKHQTDIFEETKNKEFFALLWEMRVGKTLPVIDTGNYLWEQKKIDTVVIVAPNGVHLNWSRIAIPQWGTDVVEVPLSPRPGKYLTFSPMIFEWASVKSKNKKFQADLKKVVEHKGLLWFCCNVEATWTNALEEFLAKLAETRKCLLIVDESHKCKTPSSRCTKAVLRLARKCPYRRILTGTPSTQGPFDLWSQFYILSPNIFTSQDSGGNKFPMRFTAFKQEYGYWKRMRFGSGPAFDQLDTSKGEGGYKNLDKLYEIIQPYSSRLTQAEVFDNLPELVHETRLFEMSAAHRRVYNTLRDELVVQLDSGETLTAQAAIVALIRLQQISRGFTGGIDDPQTTPLGKPYPSLEALKDILEQVEGKAIIWCRFRADVNLILDYLNIHEADSDKIFVRYDGEVKAQDRTENLRLFMTDPRIKGIVGTPAAGGIGVDMSAADTMIFYSYDYKLAERLQAIARMQGPNQKSKSLLLIDLVAADTTDEACIQAVQDKKDIAALITGDKLREMLRKEC